MKQLIALICLLSCSINAQACSQDKPINNKQTFKDCLAIAERGDIDSQFYIGQVYELGQRVKKSMVKADMWLRIAASNGNEQADAAIFEIEKKMSDEQISEAKRLAQQWLLDHKPSE